MALKIRIGDTVRVIAGKSIGREGKVIAIDRKKNRVTVEGANMVTKHNKPSMANQNGGITQVEAAMDISNVMLVVDGTPTRVGFKFEKGKKYRYARKTGKIIDEITSSKRK